MKPQNNFVIITWKNEANEDRENESGLILPAGAGREERAIEVGEIVSLPTEPVDFQNKPLKLKVGDKILFVSFSVFDFKLDGKETWAINAKDIIAIL